MLLKEFPDIDWLKKAISQNFSEKRSWDNQPLPNLGWPTAILNVKTHQAERKDIKGPFSIFLNISGQSQLTCDQKTININSDTYIISNHGQHYDLLIKESAETFNIHFGEKLYQDTIHTLSKTTSQILDHTTSEGLPFNLNIKSNFRDHKFNSLVQQVRHNYNSEEKENVLFELLSQILLENHKHFKQVENVSSIRISTKEELIRRIYLAVDFIHAYYTQPITLDQLADAAMLSKFHFLRVFKSIFRVSPHQYIKQIRLEKAMVLIKQNKLPLYLIAQQVGLENGSSLSRMIYQLTGLRPTTLAYK